MGSREAEEFRSSLCDLTVNSRPLISMLTMLAEENQAHAKQIVDVIEKHIYQVKLMKRCLVTLFLIINFGKNGLHVFYVYCLICDVKKYMTEKSGQDMLWIFQLFLYFIHYQNIVSLFNCIVCSFRPFYFHIVRDIYYEIY